MIQWEKAYQMMFNEKKQNKTLFTIKFREEKSYT